MHHFGGGCICFCHKPPIMAYRTGSESHSMTRKLHYGWIVAATTFVILLIGAGIRATPGVLAHTYSKAAI